MLLFAGRGSISAWDRERVVRRVSSVLGCFLDSVEEVGKRRMLARLRAMPPPGQSDSIGQLLQSENFTPTLQGEVLLLVPASTLLRHIHH